MKMSWYGAIILLVAIAGVDGYQKIYDACQETGLAIRDEEDGQICSPRFPDHYPGGQSCMWIIDAPEGQTIECDIQYIDLPPPDDKGFCPDKFSIVDGKMDILFDQCDSKLAKKRIKAKTSKIMVMFQTYADLRNDEDRRGFLLGFHAVGCRPPVLDDSRVAFLHDNGTSRVVCPSGYSERHVCHGNQWKPPVRIMSAADCEYYQSLTEVGATSRAPGNKWNQGVKSLPENAPNKILSAYSCVRRERGHTYRQAREKGRNVKIVPHPWPT